MDAPGSPGERKHAPFKRAAILNYLQLPEKDPGHEAALAWLKARHRAQPTTKDITEQDRKDFLAHVLESKVCVGWHWFKYSDNNPAEPDIDPPNRDANKGLVTARYETYPELLGSMKALNERV